MMDCDEEALGCIWPLRFKCVSLTETCGFADIVWGLFPGLLEFFPQTPAQSYYRDILFNDPKN